MPSMPEPGQPGAAAWYIKVWAFVDHLAQALAQTSLPPQRDGEAGRLTEP